MAPRSGIPETATVDCMIRYLPLIKEDAVGLTPYSCIASHSAIDLLQTVIQFGHFQTSVHRIPCKERALTFMLRHRQPAAWTSLCISRITTEPAWPGSIRFDACNGTSRVACRHRGSGMSRIRPTMNTCGAAREIRVVCAERKRHATSLARHLIGARRAVRNSGSKLHQS
jgi:hypothetical protein